MVYIQAGKLRRRDTQPHPIAFHQLEQVASNGRVTGTNVLNGKLLP